jgi:hypothetical protein
MNNRVNTKSNIMKYECKHLKLFSAEEELEKLNIGLKKNSFMK